jgi:hypothetical protein
MCLLQQLTPVRAFPVRWNRMRFHLTGNRSRSRIDRLDRTDRELSFDDAAHAMCTPISIIVGYTTMLKRLIPSATEERLQRAIVEQPSAPRSG